MEILKYSDAAPENVTVLKRRSEFFDEIEQKDVVLDMLENKLKEARDKKKKKTEQNLKNIASKRGSDMHPLSTNCGSFPTNVDLTIRAKGIAAVGESDTALRFGEFGKSFLKLNSTGVANVGRANLQVNTSNGALNIPLEDLFIGRSQMDCKDTVPTHDLSSAVEINDTLETRRKYPGDNSLVASDIVNNNATSNATEVNNNSKVTHPIEAKNGVDDDLIEAKTTTVSTSSFATSSSTQNPSTSKPA
ncbi:uncharacterized protein LOC132902296 [Amyelois transitella]|uniref:uncharacterized protein LOC132902296 n=1 Tax=Amyelois transitella TaxID=680683 RepID=UPI00298F65CB|nr:uncharacterized protein LOC132902296 [Amyelois transitella]